MSDDQFYLLFAPAIKEFKGDLTRAAIFGLIWRRAQNGTGRTRSSLEALAASLFINEKTIRRHAKELVKDSYIIDHTPDARQRMKNKEFSITEKGLALVPQQLRDKMSPNNEECQVDEGEADKGQDVPNEQLDAVISGQNVPNEEIKGQNVSNKGQNVQQRYKEDISLNNKDNNAHDARERLFSELDNKGIRLSGSDFETLLPMATYKLFWIHLNIVTDYLKDFQSIVSGLSEIKEIGPQKFKDKYQRPAAELLPDTPQAEMMFSKLAIELRIRGQPSPPGFPTAACKRKFEKAVVSLNGTFEAAVEDALAAEITDIKGLVNYISKYKDRANEQRSTTRSQSGSNGPSRGRKRSRTQTNTGNGSNPGREDGNDSGGVLSGTPEQRADRERVLRSFLQS